MEVKRGRSFACVRIPGFFDESLMVNLVERDIRESTFEGGKNKTCFCYSLLPYATIAAHRAKASLCPCSRGRARCYVSGAIEKYFKPGRNGNASRRSHPRISLASTH